MGHGGLQVYALTYYMGFVSVDSFLFVYKADDFKTVFFFLPKLEGWFVEARDSQRWLLHIVLLYDLDQLFLLFHLSEKNFPWAE